MTVPRGLLGTLGGLLGEATDEALYPAYAVVLAGQGLMIPPGGYQRSMSQQFAAKLSTATGTTQNDRLGDQVLLLNDWSGGEGRLRHGAQPNTDMYRRGSGINIYDEEGAVGLGPRMTAPAALQTAFNAITAMSVYRQYLVIGRSDGKVYRWDGTNLDLAGDTGKSTGGITAFGVFENNLYIGNGQDGKVWRWVGTTLLTSFAENYTIGPYAGGTVTGVLALSAHVRGNFYSSFYAARSSNAAMVGEGANTAGTTDPAGTSTLLTVDDAATVLLQYKNVLLAIVNGTLERISRLYVGTNASPTAWSLAVARIDDSLISCGCVVQGPSGDVAYFGDRIKGRIYKWDGSNFRLYRQLGSDLLPYSTAITGMVGWRGALWVSIIDTDGTCALLRDDGTGSWSRPVTGLTGTTPGPLAVWQDQLYGVTNTTGATKVFRTDGTFVGTGWVESPLENANLTGTGKLWRGVQVNHSALVSTQSVEVQYQLDDTGAWTSLGTSNTVGATSKDFDFPGPINTEQIGFKAILTGTAGSSTPLRVFSLVPRYLPAPDSLKEWQIKVLLHGTTDTPMPLSDGSTEPLTGEELSEYVWSLVDAKAPIAYLDIDRQEYEVHITDWTDSLASRSIQLRATTVGWELEGQLKLREVG